MKWSTRDFVYDYVLLSDTSSCLALRYLTYLMRCSLLCWRRSGVAQQHREHWDDIQPIEIEESALDDAGVSIFGVKSASLKNGGSYRILYICASAAAFVNAMTFSVLAPFLPDYLSSRFGSSSTQVGLIMATFPAVNLVTSPLIGWLMTRHGRLGVLLMGLVTLTVATMMYAVAPGVIWLYVASGLHGASLSLIHISSLALLSAFPERLTESMAGIEVWSGMASIIGPPLGGLACLWGGVPSAFLFIALFPFVMLLLVPRIQRLVRAAKDVPGEVQPVNQIPFWRVLFNRRVLAGAFATSFDCGVIGFLEPTLSPHLMRSWASSPRAMGFVFVVPNIVYTCMASKAQAVVDKVGVKNTLLYGLGIMSLSLTLFGPSPVLSPVLPSRVAARTSIGVGMLLFEVGSALVSVPTFAVMQGGVSSMGSGADNAVASVHSLSIGLGEAIGPVLGGMMMEILPQSPALACDPRAFLQETMIPEAAIVAAESSQKEGGNDRYHSHRRRSKSSASTEERPQGVGAGRTLDESNVRLSSESELETLSWDSQIVAAVEHVERIERSRLLRYRGERPYGGENREEFREGELGGVHALSSGGPVLFPSVRLLENEGVDKDLRLTPAFANESVETSKARVGQVAKGGGKGEIDTVMRVGEEDVSSCDTAFPMATTLMAWISCVGILAVHRLLPRHKVDVTSRSTGERAGVNAV